MNFSEQNRNLWTPHNFSTVHTDLLFSVTNYLIITLNKVF